MTVQSFFQNITHRWMAITVSILQKKLFWRSVDPKQPKNVKFSLWSIIETFPRGGAWLFRGCAKILRGGAKRSQGRCAHLPTPPLKIWPWVEGLLADASGCHHTNRGRVSFWHFVEQGKPEYREKAVEAQERINHNSIQAHLVRTRLSYFQLCFLFRIWSVFFLCLMLWLFSGLLVHRLAHYILAFTQSVILKLKREP